MRRAWLIGACACALAGCDGGGGAGDAAPIDASGADGNGCTARWTSSSVGAATHSATVSGGALELRSSDSQTGSVLSVKGMSALEGDFDARFSFEGFVSGGDGAFVQAVVVEEPANGGSTLVTAGIGTPAGGGGVMVSAAFQPGAVDVQAATAAAGVFEIVRVGDQVTVTSATGKGAGTASVTATLGTFPVAIGLQIGATAAAPVEGETRVKVTAFEVTGGGGAVTGDGFDCDSVE